ncbi:hypothetical protein Tco_1366416, partial [Tanacetum coccineum]
MLRTCPHHVFTELTQIDTFYNGLNGNDQDSLNAVAGGNLLSKTTREALNIIENKSKTDERIDKLADQISTLVEIVTKKVVTPATVKAVEEICVTCGGPHAYYNCPNTDSNQSSVCAATGTYNQVVSQNRIQMAPPGFAPVQNNGQNSVAYEGPSIPTNPSPKKVVVQETEETTDKEQSNFEGSTAHILPPVNPIPILEPNVPKTLPKPNIPYPSRHTVERELLGDAPQKASQKAWRSRQVSYTLPSNTIPNPKGEMKATTTRSGVAYKGPSIPTNPSPKKVVERETEETTDKEQFNFQGSTAHIPPPVNPIPIPEPDVPKTLPKPNIPYSSRRNDQKSRDKASYQKEKIFQMFQDLRFDISFADALFLMPRFAPTIRNLLMNKEKLLELAKIPLNENCSAID